MIEELLKNNADDISKFVGQHTSLNSVDAGNASNTILSTISNFVGGGNFDISQMGDLFNKETSNTANPLFSQISGKVSEALTEKGLPADVVSKLSGSGLDSIISKLSNGNLQNFDFSSMLGNIGNTDQLMDKAKDLLGGFFK